MTKPKGVVGKAPAFQWYPGDHRRDTAVQACSFEARALWREMLDLMHDGKPRGYLTAGGLAIDVEALARMVGAPLASVRKWMRELEDRHVFSRTDEGTIYSRRMVKDEHIAEVRRDSGKLGGNPNLVNQNTNHVGNQSPNQRGEQNPTPAVADCGLRSAAASFPLERLNARSGADTATAPLADAAVRDAAAAFLERFYADAGEKRRGDVLWQLVSSLEPSGARLGKGQHVHAGSPERLIAKMREVMRDGVKDPDKAIRVLLLKLGDTSDGSAPGVAAAADVEREERATEADIAAAERWLALQPPHVAENLETCVDHQLNIADGQELSEIQLAARRMARTSLVVVAWRDRPPDPGGHPIPRGEAAATPWGEEIP